MQIETTTPGPEDPAVPHARVPARDGVELATDIYLPDGEGPWPAVLVRQPYDKNGRYCFFPQTASHFTDRGYAFVVQDVRGKFRSGGETVLLVHEVDDGYDAIEWITHQPWSNGAVGMWGDSYYGFTQWAAAASRHPALRAIVPRVTSADLSSAAFRWDTQMGLYAAQFWTDNNTYYWEPDWSLRPLATFCDPQFAEIGRRSVTFDRQMQASETGAFAEVYPGGHPFDGLQIPVLHGVGWFDNLSAQHLREYEQLIANPATAPLQYLHAGSSDHEAYHLEQVPITDDSDHSVNEEALERMLPGYVGPALDFFDAFLSGRADPAAVPRVQWHKGNDGWHEAPSWPPPGAHEQRLHLGAAGRATADAAGGELTFEPAPPSSATWTHDPVDLVPSTVSNPFAFLHEYPDEREVEARPDVLTFTGDPLDSPLDLAGPVTAHLEVETSGPSLHLHVKLVDVAPDGRASMIVRGHAVGAGSPADVSLGHTGYRVLTGHRLRLHVAASDFPLYVPNPGTAENPWWAVETARNELELRAGGGRSYVALTVLAAG